MSDFDNDVLRILREQNARINELEKQVAMSKIILPNKPVPRRERSGRFELIWLPRLVWLSALLMVALTIYLTYFL